MSEEELRSIIEKTQSDLNELENGKEGDEEGEDENEENEEEAVMPENDEKADKDDEMESSDQDIEKKYGLDTYDDDEENADAAALGNLVAYANPRDDAYLINPDQDDDASDIEDFIIKPSDNLLLAGHIEGNASILEVYGNFSISL